MHEMDSSMPGAPTVMVVDAGDVFVGGRYHSLVPILRLVKGALRMTETENFLHPLEHNHKIKALT